MREALLKASSLDMLSPRSGVGRPALHAGRVVVGCAVGLVALGLVMLHSYGTSRGLAPGSQMGANDLLTRQLRWVFLALLAGGAASFVPASWLRRFVVPLFLTTLVLLGLVPLLGHEVKGAQRWIFLAGVSVQPSELLKLAVLLYLADRLAAREEDAQFGPRPGIAALLAPIGLGAVLVLVQPDLGTSLFVVAEAVVLLALAGVRPTRFLPFALTVTPLILFYAYTRFAHVRERLAGTGAQVEEAVIAIGSGGLAGVGLGEGAQKVGSVPEIHTDFIFALIGEELGLLGCAGVILAFMAIAWYGSRLAWYARVLGPHAYYLAAGAVFIVTFQALINIAVVTDVAPTKGIPLPFISKGGSNLLIVCVAVGLLANVARRTAAAAGEEPWTGA